MITTDYAIEQLPSAQPEQRYTEEELRVFQHGISLSLLSKRSSQHWQYDEDTATEIKFLERLYEKVVADMRGEQDGLRQKGGVRSMADWKHTCPICEYDFEHCQCRFAGKAHPDRNIRRRAVLDHLQYLYDEQIAHIQKLQEWWNTSGEGEYQEVVDELKVKHGEE